MAREGGTRTSTFRAFARTGATVCTSAMAQVKRGRARAIRGEVRRVYVAAGPQRGWVGVGHSLTVPMYYFQASGKYWLNGAEEEPRNALHPEPGHKPSGR